MKIVYMYSRRAVKYNFTYDEYHEHPGLSSHHLGLEYIIPADSQLDGIKDV